jgi:iron(III) transport system substrate-binding protein
MKRWILLGVLVLGSFVLGVSQQVLVYAALDEPTLQAIAEAFTAKTGIKVVWLTGGAGELAARIRAEAARPQADVFIGGSIDIYGDLALAGLLESIEPPNAANIPAEFKDSQGRYFGWYLGVLGLVINTDLLAELGLPEPKTWDDLLGPQWKGRVVSSNPATAGAGYIFLCTQIFRFETVAPFFGFTGEQIIKEAEAAAWKWFEQFKANVAQFTAKATEPITLVAQGQAVAGMSWAHDILTWIEQGYPLKLIIPPYTGFEIGGVGVIKGAPHPQEAVAFVNFVLSKEAQTINATVGAKRYPVSPGVISPTNAPAFESVILVPYDRTWAINNRGRLLDEWERRIAR